MSEAAPALTRFSFTSGPLRGTDLTLHPTSLVHRSGSYLETLPLAGMTAVRVAFERETGKLGWGIVLAVAALVLLAITAPLGNWAGRAAAEMSSAAGQGVPGALYSFFRALEALASFLPVGALACVIGGGALCAIGWMGNTTLAVSLPGTERIYPARGRDTLLLDFAEALSERLMGLKR